MQLLESPIPPLTAAALRMIICKRQVPPDYHLQEAGPPDDHLQEAGPSGSSFARGRPLILKTTKRSWKMHFWDSSQWEKMCFECQRNQFQWKKSKFSHLCTVRAENITGYYRVFLAHQRGPIFRFVFWMSRLRAGAQKPQTFRVATFYAQKLSGRSVQNRLSRQA